MVFFHVVAFYEKLLIGPFSHACGRGLSVGTISIMLLLLVSCLSMLYKIGTVKRSPVGVFEPINYQCGLSWVWQECSGVGSDSMGLGFKVFGFGGTFFVI